MMEQAVAYRRFVNIPPFRVAHHKMRVRPMSIVVSGQVRMEHRDILFEMGAKNGNVLLLRLALLKLCPR